MQVKFPSAYLELADSGVWRKPYKHEKITGVMILKNPSQKRQTKYLILKKSRINFLRGNHESKFSSDTGRITNRNILAT
ncbi:hypothetical protein SR1949_01690 [Sphaerospermopsis reniformis]|uniref:Uncharacterized protein n=1 Tax=Sphaerospermopsis reniformis TaxID=531300 RepID=A0A479ZRG1_9CYAN|nr:hypothetical protein SR1949_01690 [Sphaerospermopsis reniformis]